MDAQAILTVSTAVVALTSLIKWSPLPTDGFIPVLIVFGLSALGVLLWAFSVEPGFDRHQVFSYFAAWILVATAAGGVYGFGQATAKAVGGGK